MLTERSLRDWLRQARNGHRTPRVMVEALRRLPFEDLGVARLDTHRRLRRGVPEIIFGEGKTPDQIAAIARRLLDTGELVLITRIAPAVFEQISAQLPGVRYDPIARLAFRAPHRFRRRQGLTVVLSGGTSDLPIAEEAAVTLELLGSRVERLYDVGVAGVHRLLAHWRALQRARAIIVVAGMEGALASVVAGLVRCPVVAVPTSVGYGAGFQGLAPLLAMMNSCVPGIGVVNIDNGFGAAYLAHLINNPRK